MREIKGIVFNIQRFSIHDGPGIRTLVFLKGCFLRCDWCSNPESQKAGPELVYQVNTCIGCRSCEAACPHQAIRFAKGLFQRDHDACELCGACVAACPTGALYFEGRWYTVDEIMAEVVKDMPFYESSGGGVTLSGGEPLFQRDFSIGILEKSRDLGINTAIETTGSVSRETLLKAARLSDTILYDVKHYDAQMHRRFTGVENTLILQNLMALIQEGYDPLVRIPVIPGFNYGAAHAEKFAALLKSLGVKRFQLLPYHTLGRHKYGLLGLPYKMGETKPLEDDELSKMRAIMKKVLEQ